MPDLRNTAIVILLIVSVLLGLAAMQFRTRAVIADSRYSTLASKVETTNKEAADLLATRTAERDALQGRLDAKALAQEKTDAIAQSQIAADSARAAPVRVRVVAAKCDRNPDGGAPSDAVPREAGPGPASGVLAPEAQQLFARDTDAVEQLQAAFNSCKAAQEW